VLFIVAATIDLERLSLKAERPEAKVVVQFPGRQVPARRRGLDDLNVLGCMTKHGLDNLHEARRRQRRT